MLLKPVNIVFSFFGILCLFIYCEWIIYFVVQYQCTWPELNPRTEDPRINSNESEPVRIMAIADTHLLGSRQGHWFDKLRREWQMYRAFQTAMFYHHPDLVFVLGDITDEGYYCTPADFMYYIRRFQNLFAVPENTKIYTVVGNHDIGFHYRITPYINQRFVDGFNSSSVQLITLRGNHMVLINSMALEGDGCSYCRRAEAEIQEIESVLKCAKDEKYCQNVKKKLKLYSRPILMQHFPLYRMSDKDCDEPDEAPSPLKQKLYKEGWDCLTEGSTYQLLHQLRPRLVLDGHSHHGCTRNLSYISGIEATLPSFSWRNKNNPSYLLLTSTPNNYAFSKCLMPQESTVINIYVIGCTIVFIYLIYAMYRNRRRLKFKYL